MPYSKLGEKIQAARKQRGLSQEQLAERSNMSIRAIASIEQGTREPLLRTLRKIAKVLGVRVIDLIPSSF